MQSSRKLQLEQATLILVELILGEGDCVDAGQLFRAVTPLLWNVNIGVNLCILLC